jgi:hypothetical protein
MFLSGRVITLLINVQPITIIVKEADSQSAIKKDPIMDPSGWSHSLRLGRRWAVDPSQLSIPET